MPKFEICQASLPKNRAHGIDSHVIRLCTAPVAVVCKFCGSDNVIKHGLKKNAQQYLCKACGRVFTDKDTPENKQTDTAMVGSALGMFFEGLSCSDISRQLETTFKEPINPSTIYRWVMEYARKAHDFMDTIKAKTSDTWVVDETMVKVTGKNVWYWDVIDDQTRFLIDTHLSEFRTINDVEILFRDCVKRTDHSPHFILSDGMKAYPEGIERVFGADSHHIVAKGITAEINTNLIERFHSTLKERYKVMRGLKTMESAYIVLNGFVVHYNFFRPHMTLGNTTPAKAAGIKLPFTNWEGFIRFYEAVVQ